MERPFVVDSRPEKHVAPLEIRLVTTVSRREYQPLLLGNTAKLRREPPTIEVFGQQAVHAVQHAARRTAHDDQLLADRLDPKRFPSKRLSTQSRVEQIDMTVEADHDLSIAQHVVVVDDRQLGARYFFDIVLQDLGSVMVLNATVQSNYDSIRTLAAFRKLQVVTQARLGNQQASRDSE